MTDTRLVKIESILDSQIPEFLSSDSPLFKEFLSQYYLSQEYKTGIVDIANNLSNYKDISTYSKENFHNSNHDCYLIEDVLTFDDEIEVNSAEGFPDRYGLILIDDEIITYTGISKENDTVKFIGCIRGFSGVSEINYQEDSDGLIFKSTLAQEHLAESKVKNLNLVFYNKLFEKFKYHYLPDFENRNFNSKVDLELILSRARDFYLTKGTDISFKILFEVLYGDNISVIKPQEYIIKASDDETLITKNILVERLFGQFEPLDLIGRTITQNLPDNITASAAIYNIEFRPTDEYSLYEISLDVDSFVYDFISTKKTVILEKLSNSIIVDSTIGFPEQGRIYVKIKNEDLTTSFIQFSYTEKTINQFLNISEITDFEYDSIKIGDEIIEDNLLEINLDDSTVRFRLVNVIENFDFSDVNSIQVNDLFFLSSFGDSFIDKPEFTSWIYNYPTYHKIKSITGNFIQLVDSVDFVIGEEIDLIDDANVKTTVKIVNILSKNEIEVDISSGTSKVKLKKKIAKNNQIQNNSVYIQNTYLNEENNSLIVATSGLPLNINVQVLNPYSFSIVGISSSVFVTKDLNSTNTISHNLLSGNRIYLDSKNVGLGTGQYYVKKIDETKISLFRSTGDLYLSFSKNSNSIPPISVSSEISTGIIGICTRFEYVNSSGEFKNQLLLKEFKVEETLFLNKVSSTSPIYNIEQAYSVFS